VLFRIGIVRRISSRVVGVRTLRIDEFFELEGSWIRVSSSKSRSSSDTIFENPFCRMLRYSLSWGRIDTLAIIGPRIDRFWSSGQCLKNSCRVPSLIGFPDALQWVYLPPHLRVRR